jgi:hypothetical protein
MPLNIADPNSHQVAGEHYAGKIQHWDVMIAAFGPSYLVGYATKYIARYKKKDPVKDLEKALHTVEKLISVHSLREFPMPRMMPVGFAEFAKEHFLSRDQVHLFHLLLGYTKIEELELAHKILNKLLGEERQ